MSTQGQQQAQENLNHVLGTTWRDWVPAAGNVPTPNGNISSGAWSDQQVQLMMNAPEGTFSGSQIQAAIDAANATAAQGPQALGQKNYDDKLTNANQTVQWWKDNPNGHDLGTIGDFMEKVFPVIVAAWVGGSAGGLFGAAEGAAAGGVEGAAAGLGDLSAAGLGSLPIDSAALGMDGLGWAGYGSLGAEAGAGLGAGAGAGAGLGSMIGIEGGAPAVVSVGAPTAGGGLGLGTGLGASLGAGALLGSNPTLPINHDALQQMPNVNGQQPGVPYPESSLPPLIVPPLANHPELGAVNPVADGAANLPIPPHVPQIPTPGGSGIPGLGDLLGGLGPLLGGNVARIKAQQDSDWWKSQLDTLQGMYKPGTQEATLMENKMNAMDAATGRNSQYGVRAVNLASNLADKRAGIMTSPGYQNMANAYRNRSSQDLNGLFGALGNTNTQNLLSGVGNLIGNGLGSLFGQSTPPVR